MKQTVTLAICLLAAGVAAGLLGRALPPREDASLSSAVAPAPTAQAAEAETPPGVDVPNASRRIAPPAPRPVELVVDGGDTMVGLLREAGIAPGEALAAGRAFQTASEVPLRPGDRLDVGKNVEGELVRLVVALDGDRRFVVEPGEDDKFRVRRGSVEHAVELVHAGGAVETSVMALATKAGIPPAIALKTASVLGLKLDLQRELRKGDRLEVIYERRTDVDTGETHPGRLSFLEFAGRRASVSAYLFDPGDGPAFYDQDGRSLRTGFLRTPVDGARLSSTFGKRDHPILGYTRKHEGLDFAAAPGTPVKVASDGVVRRARRYGSYGNFVLLAHRDGLSTAYAHLKRYAPGLEPGDQVNQGETIGYVGATGLATGPNLHYEIRRNGRPIDPATLDRPPRRRLAGAEMPRFKAVMEKLKGLVETAHAAAEDPPDADGAQAASKGTRS